MNQIKINKRDFELAFEYDAMFHTTPYLNTKTGDIIYLEKEDRKMFETWAEDELDSDLTFEEILLIVESLSDDYPKEIFQIIVEEELGILNYASLPEQNSDDAFKEMEAFVRIVKDKHHRESLNVALSGWEGVFGRFNHVIHTQNIQDNWYKFREDRKYKRMAAWLKSQNIEPSFF